MPAPRLIPRCWGLLVLLTLFSLPALAQEEAESKPAPEISGAIYLDAWQIKKEIIISPLALQKFMEFERELEEGDLLTPEQREALKPAIGEFLATKCPLFQNDEAITFTLDRIQFVEPTTTEFLLIDEQADVAVENLRISATYAAPNTDLKSELRMKWNLFTVSSPQVTVTVADTAASRVWDPNRLAGTFSFRGRYRLNARNAPEAPPAPAIAVIDLPWLSIWLLVLALPALILVIKKRTVARLAALALCLLGAAGTWKAVTFPMADPSGELETVTAESSQEVLNALLRRVYHSFHYRDESERYDFLAETIHGDELQKIYLEVQRTLESRDRDGSKVRVNDLDVTESEPAPLEGKRGFESDCAWKASGRVGHWGHFHDRENLFRATIQVEPVDGTWKITGLTLHSRDRQTEP